jgi:hypothetical protein
MMEMNDFEFERLKVVLDPFLNIFILKHRRGRRIYSIVIGYISIPIKINEKNPKKLYSLNLST